LAATNTTTTTQTDTSSQTGTKLVVSSDTNTQSIGDYVTNVAVQPYIASRIVSFVAYNMRPNCRMHIFFNSVNIDQYCAPGIVPTTITDTSDYKQVVKNDAWGATIYSDANGMVAGQFNIPEAKFKTGDSTIQISDVDSLVYGNNAYTSISSATFTASNLNVTKQNITLTTVNPEISYVPVTNTVITTNTTVTIKQIPDIIKISASAVEPLAQALTINTPQGEAGIFATSIDIFFKKRSLLPNHGCTVYLCEMVNGFPNGKAVLPFSRVHLGYSDINVSENAATPTTFTFEAPVFLQNGKEYAFVVKPDANDPDYYVYTANMGDTDLTTGLQVFSQPIVGTAYYGATDSTWSALPTEYVKFELRRASFANNHGEAVFVNKSADFLNVYSVGYTSGQSIIPGDYVFESANEVSNSVGGSVNTSIFGIVNYYDQTKNLLYVDRSVCANGFNDNAYMQVHRFANSALATAPNNATIIAWANTGPIQNIGVDALVTQLAAISPAGTTLSVNYKGTSNTYSIDTDYQPVNVGSETEFFDKSRIVASKSIEDFSMSGQKSLYIKASMATDTDYLSPLIDTVRHQELAIRNDIDPIGANYDEFFVSGNAKSKYISKIVTLASGQDAEDLQVIVSAFRPANSDVQVWVRFLNGDDGDPISLKTWTPLINGSQGLYSDPSNPNDFREYTFSVGAYYKMISTTGTIDASNTSTTLTGYNTLFTSELAPGWSINMRANTTFSEVTRQIVSIAGDTSLELNLPFNGNYTNTAYYLVPPPTTPWLSTDSKYQLTGNVSTYTTNNTIVGNGTTFTTQVAPSDIIAIGADKQQVVSVVNNTILTVGSPWTSNNTGADVYIVTPAGLTYLNKDLGIYSGFKQFQIKIVLLSDDSSKVPIIDNVRALALQL
jgi:hypothetical protein